VPDFQPYVSPAENRPEFTARALLLGSFFGIVFGAVTVYVGLRAGLTVAASIPISVLSISILRVFGKSSILENNIVQTTGNAGQSIASGVIFTLPALIFLGFDLEYSRIFLLALVGGWLGVLFMIPLRRQLIVEEHGTLAYPEGTACADVLMAGDRGGSFASRVFLGLGLGGVYTLFQNENLFAAWPGTPNYEPDLGAQHVLKGAAIRCDATPEYLGVGYIIGPKVSGIIFAGGVFSWLVLMPLIHFFGAGLDHPIYPGTIPISAMSPSQLWSTYIRPMGAGAVAAAGLITLVKTIPTIVGALTSGFSKMRKSGPATVKAVRTEDDLPMSVVIGGSLALVAIMFFFLQFKPCPRHLCRPTGQSRRFAPRRGLRIPLRHRQLPYRRPHRQFSQPGLRHDHRYTHGHIRDLPRQRLDSTRIRSAGHHRRRRGLHRRVQLRRHQPGPQNRLPHRRHPTPAADRADDRRLRLHADHRRHPHRNEHRISGIPRRLAALGHQRTPLRRQHPKGRQSSQRRSPSRTQTKSRPPTAPGEYLVLNALGSSELADGKYLYSPASHKIEVQWIQGIGSENAAAPQARLMATVINGILSQKLPWGLVLMGVFVVIAVELLGIRSLSFAVGSYLSIGTTLAIFVGGMVRFMVDSALKKGRPGSRRKRDQPRRALRLRPDRRRRHRRPYRRGHQSLRIPHRQPRPHPVPGGQLPPPRLDFAVALCLPRLPSRSTTSPASRMKS
jgi:uncharacterized oligopeptide transporter (OPT) family protein